MKSTARIATHPIHPMLVAFPLGLWTTSFIVNVIGAVTDNFVMHQVAYYMVLAGCIGAVLAAIPGLIDLFTAVAPGTPARATGIRHALLNVIALSFWIASLYARQGGGGMTMTAYITAAVALAITSLGGWLGGTMVYDHYVGVPNVGEKHM
ncbi:MAG TPA: DUF2231 domain-containing protein [Gemmatimonadaceae bacterium]|nr:DUF2231 domain-containing protein [Gemmatimonadaceae bacterium]